MGKIKDDYSCALLLTMDLLGGKWKLRILWHIINGDNRFSLLGYTILLGLMMLKSGSLAKSILNAH